MTHMPDNVSVELLYRGSDVDDGTMPVEYMLNALAGFSGAFIKLARLEEAFEPQNRIRVVGLQRGSAKILIDVVDWIVKNPAAAGVIATTASGAVAGAYIVLKDFVGVILGKKALHGQPITFENCNFVDNSVVLNGIPVSPRQFDILKSGLIDEDLARMTAPLGRGVDAFELRAEKEVVQVSSSERHVVTGHVEDARQVEERREVPPKQRPLFSTTGKIDMWLEGRFVSHSKRTNRGMFDATDGRRLKYQFVGKDTESLLRAYVSGGTVQVFGPVDTDEGGTPVSIKIREVQPSGTNPMLSSGR